MSIAIMSMHVALIDRQRQGAKEKKMSQKGGIRTTAA